MSNLEEQKQRRNEKAWEFCVWLQGFLDGQPQLEKGLSRIDAQLKQMVSVKPPLELTK